MRTSHPVLVERGAMIMAVPKFGDGRKCSFCGKTQKQVQKLIAGPGVYICDECVGLCVDILKAEGVRWKRRDPPRAARK